MRWKTAIGVLLMALSLVGMLFWEFWGRERLMQTPVLTVNADMEKGDRVTSDLLEEIRVPAGSAVKGALTPGDAAGLIGMEADCRISAGEQLLPFRFSKKEEGLRPGFSSFTIPSKWICGRSSSLRARDIVKIYLLPEKEYLGRYEVSFVKDSSEQEVVGGPEGHILERRVSSSVIEGIEILCKLEDFFTIYEAVNTASEEEAPGRLLIVTEL